MQWNSEHRVYCVEHYTKASSQRALRIKLNTYRKRSIPHNKSILKWVAQLIITRALRELRSWSPLVSARFPDEFEQIRGLLTEEISGRQHENILFSFNISRWDLGRIFQMDYKFAWRSVWKCKTYSLHLHFSLVMTHFNLYENVNQHNFSYWTTIKSRQMYQVPLLCPIMTV